MFAYRTSVRYNGSMIHMKRGVVIMDKMKIAILLDELLLKSKSDFELFEEKVKEVIQEPSE